MLRENEVLRGDVCLYCEENKSSSHFEMDCDLRLAAFLKFWGGENENLNHV